MHIDDVLESLGERGYYPYVPYVFMCFVVVARAWHILAMAFLGWYPPIDCVLNANQTDLYRSVGSKDVCHAGLKGENEKCGSDLNCYVLDSSNATHFCPGEIKFNNTGSSRSIVEEWDYACQNASFWWFFRYTDLGKTFYVFGALLGYILVVPWADKIGRKPMTLGCTWVMGLTGLMSLATGNIYGFYVIRFIGGLCYAGTGVVWTWTCEIFSQRTRTTPVVLLDIAYTVGVMTLPGIAWVVPGWRYLYMTISLGSLLTIPFWWLCPESVKWLYSAGKEARGRELLEKLARQKNVVVPEKIETGLTEEEEKSGKDEKPLIGDKKDELGKGAERNGKKWTYTVILVTIFMAFIRATVSMYYYGLSFSTNAFVGDRYLNFFLFGAIEVPAILLVVVLLKVMSRRFNIFLFLSLAGFALAFLAVARVSYSKVEELTTLRLVLNLFGKFAVTAAYAGIDTYGSEVFPTEVRASCYGVIGAASRLSSLASTFAEAFLKQYPLIPEALFGFAALGAAILMLFCPETKGRPIPQRAVDLDVLKANTNYFFCSPAKRVMVSTPVPAADDEEHESAPL